MCRHPHSLGRNSRRLAAVSQQETGPPRNPHPSNSMKWVLGPVARGRAAPGRAPSRRPAPGLERGQPAPPPALPSTLPAVHVASTGTRVDGLRRRGGAWQPAAVNGVEQVVEGELVGARPAPRWPPPPRCRRRRRWQRPRPRPRRARPAGTVAWHRTGSPSAGSPGRRLPRPSTWLQRRMACSGP
jgi:hypothetical protein